MKEKVNGSITTHKLCIYTSPIRVENATNTQTHFSYGIQNCQFKLSELPVIHFPVYQFIKLYFSNVYHRSFALTLMHSYSIKELYKPLQKDLYPK